MDVAHLELQLPQIVRQVLGRALRQGEDQRALSLLRHRPQSLDQVVDLPLRGQDQHLRVRDARGADHLLHHLRGVLQLIVARRGGDEDRRVQVPLELVPLQRPVVQAGGQPESVFHQHGLAGAVAVEHAPNLRQRDVGLVHDHQEVLGEEIDQRAGRVADVAPVQVDGVVLDARAVPHLGEHLQVVARAHADALGLQELPLVREALLHPGQLRLDQGLGALDGVRLRDVVLRREDRRLRHPLHQLARQGVHQVHPLYFVVEEGDADTVLVVGGEYLDGVAPHAELPGLQHRVVALVIVLHQVLEKGAVLPPVALGE